ncbi:MAG TPA: 3-hydroxyacyl-CoA dehydrogenase NAD-binding domain-containing protein [Steroidobacteraceae bacterium]|nr:3-hydroxyacyl-CoA dehydrogenase NAD-binding domain-containing protein [Steroidobacteraceae bacterium]
MSAAGPTNAAIIGLGTMGPGIAATLARAGLRVSAYDADAAQRESCSARVAAAAGALVALGIEDLGGPAVAVHDSLGACVAGAELVIENVPEDLELKRRVIGQIESQVDPRCLIVSDTSGLPITRLAEGARHPERILGMHWSNPPQLIPMIEVIPGEQTAAAAVEALTALIRRAGHRPILIRKDVPGFVENRVLYAILRECVDLVEKGVISPADLDTCVSWGIGYKLAVVGPMALLDMAGLDIYAAVSRYLNRELSNRPDTAPYITERTARRELGLKSGRGIYSYTPESTTELRAARTAKLIAVRKALES